MQLYTDLTVSYNVVNPNDRQLVDRIVNGESRAFALVIQNTEKLVSQIVYRMISVPAYRGDISQEVYLKAFHKLKDFRFQCKLSTWIGQIAYNTCLKYLDKKRLLYLEDLSVAADAAGQEDLGPEPLFIKKQLNGILQEAVDNLPPVYRTLVVLFHIEELSYEEIATITGLPQGTIKSYLFRARRKLKDTLLSNYKREEL